MVNSGVGSPEPKLQAIRPMPGGGRGGGKAATGHWGRPCTVRYFCDQVPHEESPSTPLPNALISPLPEEHDAL